MKSGLFFVGNEYTLFKLVESMKITMDSIISNINMVYYVVDLVFGEVTVQTSDIVPPGPYKLCRNIIEANLYSLNILRQNVAENNYKTNKKQELIDRTFLGVYQTVETAKIIPTMKWLESTFPEKFI